MSLPKLNKKIAKKSLKWENCKKNPNAALVMFHLKMFINLAMLVIKTSVESQRIKRCDFLCLLWLVCTNTTNIWNIIRNRNYFYILLYKYTYLVSLCFFFFICYGAFSTIHKLKSVIHRDMNANKNIHRTERVSFAKKALVHTQLLFCVAKNTERAHRQNAQIQLNKLTNERTNDDYTRHEKVAYTQHNPMFTPNISNFHALSSLFSKKHDFVSYKT